MKTAREVVWNCHETLDAAACESCIRSYGEQVREEAAKIAEEAKRKHRMLSREIDEIAGAIRKMRLP